MYTLTQNSDFSDELKLEKADGTSEIISYSLSIGPELVKNYRTLQLKLIEAQQSFKSGTQDEKIVSETGEIVVDIFALLFGKENAKKLLDFYFGDYTKMVSDLFPYIQNVIVPEFNKIVNQRKQSFKRKKWK